MSLGFHGKQSKVRKKKLLIRDKWNRLAGLINATTMSKVVMDSYEAAAPATGLRHGCSSTDLDENSFMRISAVM